jgi:tetratricopeptide (TPR) repeat protein
MPSDSSEQPTLKITQGSPPLQGERVSFTGILASMTHRQAHELVEQHGGSATQNVSRQTSMLVVGEEGWPLESDGTASLKLQQVTEWIQQSHSIRILNESDWLRLLDLDERRREVHRLYTPAMLSQLLGISVSIIRRWERLGLIKAVRKVYRLPYFDFQEVTGVRRLSELIEAGVTRHEIEASLSSLRKVLPGLDVPLAQLELLARGSHVVLRDEIGLIEPRSGQRLMDFEPPTIDPADSPPLIKSELVDLQVPVNDQDQDARQHWTFQDWFDQGCRLLEDNQPQEAVEAFRLSLMERPDEPETQFHLADSLYRVGNIQGAMERFHVAVELDHEYIEAWTQLGCLHAELNDTDAALDAFEIAVKTHPDYPDANFHLAQLLDRLGQRENALPYWTKYLEFDCRGPWAETARQQLEQ